MPVDDMRLLPPKLAETLGPLPPTACEAVGATAGTDGPQAAGVLVSWYAHQVDGCRARCVRGISERWRLTVLLPASNVRRSLVPNL